jgi:hypothetical protein
VLTGTTIGLISLVNAVAAVRLVAAIIGAARFTTNADVLLVSGAAVWLTNVIAFALWYWDRGGAAARARAGSPPAFATGMPVRRRDAAMWARRPDRPDLQPFESDAITSVSPA